MLKMICLLGLLLISAPPMEKTRGKQKLSPYWISTAYRHCLAHDLPCACEKQAGDFFLIVLDPYNTRKIFEGGYHYYEDMESMGWLIEKRAENKYLVHKYVDTAAMDYKPDTSAPVGAITLKGDSLFIFYKNKKASFVNIKATGSYDYDAVSSENLTQINNGFLKRGYPSLNSVLKDTIKSCDCNKWVAGDQVSKRGKVWFLEKTRDSLLIYNDMDTSQTPEIPQVVSKKLFKKFKW